MGYSQDTFYRYKQAVEEGGVEALIERSRRKPNIRNRVAPEIEEAVVTLATDQPALGQVRVSNELRRRTCRPNCLAFLPLSPSQKRQLQRSRRRKWVRRGQESTSWRARGA